MVDNFLLVRVYEAVIFEHIRTEDMLELQRNLAELLEQLQYDDIAPVVREVKRRVEEEISWRVHSLQTAGV